MWFAAAIVVLSMPVPSPCDDEQACRSACDAGAGAACVELAELVGADDGEVGDENLFERACSLRDAGGCAVWGLVLEADPDASFDELREAARAYQRACALGSAAGCRYAAFAHETGRGVTTNERLAAALYARACDAGEPVACANLAGMVEDGRGASADPARAAMLEGKACDGENARACAALALRVKEGRGVANDPGRAAALEARACALGHDVSCPE